MFQFPWTNFHEMNLDWLLDKLKKTAEQIPTKISELVNDIGFITAAGAPVQSVNGKTGTVVLDADDVNALPDNYTPPVEVYVCTYGTTTNAQIETAITAGQLPVMFYSDTMYILTRRASATNHYFCTAHSTNSNSNYYYARCGNNTWTSGSGTLARLASPTFTGTPKAPTAAAADNSTQIATTAFVKSQNYVDAAGAAAAAPVQSVNGQTGTVVLDADDVGAKPASYTAPVDSVNGQTGTVVLDADDVGAMTAGTPPFAAAGTITNVYSGVTVRSCNIRKTGKLAVMSCRLKFDAAITTDATTLFEVSNITGPTMSVYSVGASAINGTCFSCSVNNSATGASVKSNGPIPSGDWFAISFIYYAT